VGERWGVRSVSVKVSKKRGKMQKRLACNKRENCVNRVGYMGRKGGLNKRRIILFRMTQVEKERNDKTPQC